MKLFGTSGIRGMTPNEISPEFCLEISKSVGTYLSVGSEICIACDTRTSSDWIKNTIIAGLLSTGVNVTDLGILPTSILSLLTKELGFDSGIMVTASHNPPEFNGIKLWNSDSIGYEEKQEEEIEKIYFSKDFRKINWGDFGKLKHNNEAREIYLDFLQRKIVSDDNEMKIVIDPGNGAASGFASYIFEKLGLNVIAINDFPDGHFSYRSPEPKETTLQGTIEFIRKNDADLAICYDGDADRVVFCDRQGFLGYNEMIAFISRLMVQEKKNKKVITTVETGRLLDLALEDLHGDVIRTKVGDIEVAKTTKEKNACIGVEQVGHYIVPEIGFCPDVIYVSLFLLNKLNNVSDIREYFNVIPKMHYIKEGIECKDVLKYDVIEKMKKHIDIFDYECVNLIDGIRFEFDDSWMLIRASGTQPLIRIIIESEKEHKMDELLEKGRKLTKLVMEEKM